MALYQEGEAYDRGPHPALRGQYFGIFKSKFGPQNINKGISNMARGRK